jgi:hypothetical protein
LRHAEKFCQTGFFHFARLKRFCSARL